MATKTTDPRKQMLLITAMLGFMAGVGAYLVFKSVTTDRLVLLVVLLPMVLASVPLVRTLKELRQSKDARTQ